MAEDKVDMPIGREMDAHVLELMGWVWWAEERGSYVCFVAQQPGEREPWHKHRDAEANKARFRRASAGEINFARHLVPILDDERYRVSTSVAAAWNDVAEPLRLAVLPQIGGSLWQARSIVHERDETASGWCLRMPEAVCRCAMKVKALAAARE